jgi:hypothetical protein
MHKVTRAAVELLANPYRALSFGSANGYNGMTATGPATRAATTEGRRPTALRRTPVPSGLGEAAQALD